MKNKKKVFFMVLLLLCSYLSSFAQLINLQLKNVTVKQAIETIQKQNGYSFAFAASDLNTKKIVTVLAKDLPIEIKISFFRENRQTVNEKSVIPTKLLEVH